MRTVVGHIEYEVPTNTSPRGRKLEGKKKWDT
jgi:hypothetical protein